MSAKGCATANGAMAKYFLHVKVFSRGQGSRVTRAAAYRAGERIRDERTSEVYNYCDRQDVLHKEIVLASQFAGRTDANWARDRAALWNAAEHAGRRNERHARGLPPSKAELLWMRERWAQVTNQMLLDAGLTERVDHRSYQAQGIDREPVPPLPKKVYYAERASGRAHPVGEAIRARYRERVEARLAGRGALERVLQRQKEEGRRRALEDSAWKARLPVKISRASLTREELNRLRRERDRGTAAEHNRKRRGATPGHPGGENRQKRGGGQGPD